MGTPGEPRGAIPPIRLSPAASCGDAAEAAAALSFSQRGDRLDPPTALDPVLWAER